MYRKLDLSFKSKDDNKISSRPYTNNQYNQLENSGNNRLLFDKTIQPSDYENKKDVEIFINKDKIVTNKKNNYDFKTIKNGIDSKKDMYFAIDDPRLIDGRRNELYFTDSIPLGQGGIVNFDKIYSDEYADYGKKYENYSDINIGNIIYRTDTGQDSEPFKNPNFVIKAGIKYNLYENPMQNIQAEYTRTPFSREHGDELSRLEFTRMSMEHREDLMATQDNKYNARKWDYRWKEPVKRVD
jgi:hypothetical protein